MLALSGSTNGIAQFLTVLIIFIFVLAITFLSTKWLANYQKSHTAGTNIKVIETVRLTVNKYIQIVKVGDKYLVVAIGKDEVTFLCEINPEELHLPEATSGSRPDFASVLEKIKKLKK